MTITSDAIRSGDAELHRPQRLLQNPASAEAVPLIGKAVMMPPTGNNIRDLFVLARS